jgi:hypothetical protein
MIERKSMMKLNCDDAVPAVASVSGELTSDLDMTLDHKGDTGIGQGRPERLEVSLASDPVPCPSSEASDSYKTTLMTLIVHPHWSEVLASDHVA